METAESLAYKNARADSYKLLSGCYYEPDERLLRILRDVDLSLGWPLNDITRCIPDGDQLGSLVVDFSRLFIGPFQLLAPPYGSVYLDGARTLMSDSTIDARRRYEQEGLELTLKEAPDYIAIELEFVYFLVAKEIGANNTATTSAADDYVKKQISFLETHLCRWIPEFVHNVQVYAQTDFYKNLARLTEAFVKADLESLRNIAHCD